MKIVLTSIFGEYDVLKEPTIITSGWRYVCITDQPLKSDVWEIINFPSLFKNQVKSARFYKILGMEFFDCDIFMWVDASIRINHDLNKLYHSGDITIMIHPHRNCVYEEAEACIKRNKDTPETINEQVSRYKKEGYPANNGMIASGLFVISKNKITTRFVWDWWKEVSRGSHRDQLSFNYVLKSHPMISINLIPFSILEHEFKLERHLS